MLSLLNYIPSVSLVQDALAVLKHAAKITELDELQKMAADVVADENINAQDALQILKKAAHIIDSF